MKFKVGDRVRYVRGNELAIPRLIGSIGTVEKVYDHELPYVNFGNGNFGPYMLENLEKIGERRVGWRVDYTPQSDIETECIGVIYSDERLAWKKANTYANKRPPVRIEYDVAVPPASKPVKVGDRVSGNWSTQSYKVIAIDNGWAWVKAPGTSTVVKVSDLKPLDDGTGKYSYHPDADDCYRSSSV